MKNVFFEHFFFFFGNTQVRMMLIQTLISQIIMKTCPCNKQSFLALKIENFQLKSFDIFLIFAQNIDCGYSLEPPRQGGSNVYPQSMF